MAENKRETVLMLANTDTALNGFLALAKMLYEKDAFCPVICLDGNLQVAELMKKNGIDKRKIVLEYLPRTSPEYKGLAIRIYYNILWRLDKWIFFAPFSIGREIRIIKRQQKILRRIFEQYRPIALIAYTDRRGGYEQTAIHIAHTDDIPVVIPSVSRVYVQQFFNNPNNGIHLTKTKRMPLLYSCTMKINKKWVWESETEYVFFRRPQESLAAYFMDMGNMNPWVLGATKPTLHVTADLESYYEIVEYLGQDTVLGRLAYATSVEETFIKSNATHQNEIREKLLEKYGIKRSRIVIFSAVPYYEAGIIDLELNKKIHKKLVECLSEIDAGIIVSLHPKMEKAKYEFLQNYENVAIADEALRDILCCADLYVGMEKSATRAWAELLGIDSLLLPERWFHEYAGVEMEEYFAKWEDFICKNDEWRTYSQKLDFMELLLKILKRENIRGVLNGQFIELNS